jgi:hypothetical protein
MMYAQYMQAPTKEVRVSKRIRQTHRWLSIIFTATVTANFADMALGEPPALVVYSPLPPLFLMLVTGLYMFVLPYLPNGSMSAITKSRRKLRRRRCQARRCKDAAQGDAERDRAAEKPLSGGNPQIAKGYGDAPMQAQIAAIPGWMGPILARRGRRLTDAIGSLRASPGRSRRSA